MNALKADPRFADMPIKIDEADMHSAKCLCAIKELVTLRLEDDVDPNVTTGKHLKPKDFYEQMQDPDTIVIDARNDYEYDLGHFAERSDLILRRSVSCRTGLKNTKTCLKAKILTYCTGGVRCEKFSGWLLKQGFEDVSQLDGGIVTYGKDPEVQGQLWDGQCYVFDERISVPVNRVEHVIIGKDYFTGEPCERYVNCANPACNKNDLHT